MKIAAGIIYVAADGQVLLVRRSATEENYAGHWAFPGGNGEPNETPEQTANREAAEELGSTAPEGKKVLLDKTTTPNGIVFYTFTHSVKEPFWPELNGEHSRAGWFQLDNLPEPIHPAVRATLTKHLGMAKDGNAVCEGCKGGGCAACNETGYQAVASDNQPMAATAVNTGIPLAVNRKKRLAKMAKDALCSCGGKGCKKCGGSGIAPLTRAPMRALDSVLRGLGVDAEFEESDHPRSPDGKFGSGSGGAGEKSSEPETPYRKAKAYSDKIDAHVAELSKKLNSFPRGNMGMTPDHVKASPEFQKAKSEYNAAFAKQKAFNAQFSKHFKKEIGEERQKKRESRTKAMDGMFAGLGCDADFEESKHPRADNGQFGSGSGGSPHEGKSGKFKESGSGSLSEQGLKPKKRASGTDVTGALQVAWSHAIALGKPATVTHTGRGGLTILKPGEKIPYNQSHMVVSPDGMVKKYHPNIDAEDSRVGAMDAMFKALAQDSRNQPEHTLTVRYDGDFSFKGLLAHMQRLGAIGASRTIEARDEDDKIVPFGWDGDGADKIWDAEIDGQKLAFDRAMIADMSRYGMAFDYAPSLRKVDKDGHMLVESSIISGAAVNDYRGDEIPGYKALGLKPDGIYPLYRTEEDLEKGAPTLHGKPLLIIHRGVTAMRHPRAITVGTVINPIWENPNLRAELAVWDGEAIKLIESGEKKSLSAGYRYVPVMEPGVYKGRRFSGRMTKIEFNHCALVCEPRYSGAHVGDAMTDPWSIIEAAILDLERVAA